MKKIHLVHIIPNNISDNKEMHIFHGYSEIIETIYWGLAQLGHEVTYAINRLDQSVPNIVFGAQMLDVEFLKTLRTDTIIYNLEQLAGVKPDDLRDSLKYCGEHFKVWEYSEFNMPTWNAFNSSKNPVHIPIGYAPILTRIAKPINQEIDILFYGAPGGNRLQIFHDLCSRLVRTVFVHGLYGKTRDDLIANSKIIINIGQYPAWGIFEIARTSYLLGNYKAVVADYSNTTKIEPDIVNAVKFSPIENIIEECLNLLDDDVARTNLENNGFNVISKRDIRKILGNAPIDI